jgi:tetratricopeptide (TPR) repeat protein
VDSKRAGQIRQETEAGRDAYTAGRNQTVVNVGMAGMGEPAVPGLLPRDVPGFTGRAGELARLAGLAGGGSIVVTAIGGTAGVGKTALAVHSAHQLLPQFPDGHLYADLRGYTEGQAAAEPGEVLEVFLRRLGVPAEAVPVGTEERSGLLRELLAPRRVLVVLDNAATEAQVRPLLPGAGSSLVLITSRSVLAGLELDARIDLDVLPDAEAVALLVKMIGPERTAAESQVVAQVARWCGCLPLALRIAGQLLAAHPAWPVARLAAMLAEEQHRLDHLTAGDRQVRAAFMVSYRQLPEPDAGMFGRLGLHPGPDIGPAAAAALAGIGPQEAAPVLDRLALAHLVTEDAAGRFRMHDLLRLFARKMCQDHDDQATRDAALTRLIGHFTELAGFLDTCLDPRLRPGIAEAAAAAGESVPSPRQALEIFEAERRNMVTVVSLAAELAWHEEVWRISGSMQHALTLLRHLDDLLTVAQAALTAAQTAKDKATESRALDNLGLAYHKLRRFEEAITCYQDALATCRETGDRHGEGQTLGNLGLAYRELRRFDEAITCHERELAIFRDTEDPHGEGSALNNLGNTYRQLRRFEEAITCYQGALAICRETRDRHGEGQTLGNLGNAYRQLRRFDEAITCHEQELAIFRETGDRHREGRALNNLGLADYMLRRFAEAIDCYQDALAIFRETGDRHREGRALNNLGNTYQELPRFEEAITCHQDALAIFRETRDRHGEGRALNNLGNAYRELPRFEEAITCHQDALAIFRETRDRHGEGSALNNLGNANWELRRFEEAITCYQDALAIFRETGDRHGEGSALNNLGNTYQELGRLAEAAASRQDALTAMRDTGDHQAVAQLELDLNGPRKRTLRRWLRRDPQS